ncbi:hypothetical protein CYMTET_20537 [Cymbomonas tetramitiformis]|uniref:Cyclic nucleotide-binding domain-containing protein n=1 Tax=Cymbomonas tetramitiformis TaxID=36881 RepID=A0AAE0G404_9CHLO|nr:hypothetical protein CYMTET_20537 [Cymbomonas tetramitiformis]
MPIGAFGTEQPKSIREVAKTEVAFPQDSINSISSCDISIPAKPTRILSDKIDCTERESRAENRKTVLLSKSIKARGTFVPILQSQGRTRPPELAHLPILEDDDAKEECPSGDRAIQDGVINPKSALIRRWDNLGLVLLTYVALVTPFEVGFVLTHYKFLYLINRLMDTYFLLDIILAFRMGYLDLYTGCWVFNAREIRKRYLRTWFVVDLVSTVPLDVILSWWLDSDELDALKILKCIRIIRLLKVLRILRAGRIFQRIEEYLEIDYFLLSVLKHALTVVVQSHWTACIFGMLEAMQSNKTNWMTVYFCDEPLDEDCNPRETESHLTVYIAALYWSVCTFTTVGYGDMYATNTEERLVVMVVMIIGAFQYGYIIGAVSSSLLTANAKKMKQVLLLNELKGFIEEGRLPSTVKDSLFDYFKSRMLVSDVNSYHAVLQFLSPQLRGEVVTMLDSRWLKMIPLFKGIPIALTMELAMSLRQETFAVNELVFTTGAFANHMYIIKKGMVMYHGRIFSKHSTLLADCLYRRTLLRSSCLTLTFTDIWYVSRDRMLHMLGDYPAINENFRLSSLRSTIQHEIRAYSKACYLSSIRPVGAPLTAAAARASKIKEEREGRTVPAFNTAFAGLYKGGSLPENDYRVQWYLEKIALQTCVSLWVDTPDALIYVKLIQMHWRAALERRRERLGNPMEILERSLREMSIYSRRFQNTKTEALKKRHARVAKLAVRMEHIANKLSIPLDHPRSHKL